MHGASPWRGEHQRRIALYRFSPANIGYGRGYLEIPPEKLAGMTDLQRAVLEPPYASRLERPLVTGALHLTSYVLHLTSYILQLTSYVLRLISYIGTPRVSSGRSSRSSASPVVPRPRQQRSSVTLPRSTLTSNSLASLTFRRGNASHKARLATWVDAGPSPRYFVGHGMSEDWECSAWRADWGATTEEASRGHHTLASEAAAAITVQEKRPSRKG